MRIGINISNGLHRRLKAIPESVNVSQICRDAIESVVRKYEEADTRINEDDLTNVIKEFADEGEQWSDIDWREYGWADARDWFQKVDRDQYERFIYDRDFYLKTPRSPEEILSLARWAPSVEGVFVFHQRFDQHQDLLYLDKEYDRLDRLGLGGYPRGNAEHEYNTAWLAYFNAVHQLIENAKKQRAEERFRNRAKMPQPEVPDHLV